MATPLYPPGYVPKTPVPPASVLPPFPEVPPARVLPAGALPVTMPAQPQPGMVQPPQVGVPGPGRNPQVQSPVAPAAAQAAPAQQIQQIQNARIATAQAGVQAQQAAAQAAAQARLTPPPVAKAPLTVRGAPYVATALEGIKTVEDALTPGMTARDQALRVTEGAGRIAGAGLGAKGGFALGAMTGPAAPYLAPIGGVAGGLTGYFSPEIARKGYETVSEFFTGKPPEPIQFKSERAAELRQAAAPTTPTPASTVAAQVAQKPVEPAPSFSGPGVAVTPGTPRPQRAQSTQVDDGPLIKFVMDGGGVVRDGSGVVLGNLNDDAKLRRQFNEGVGESNKGLPQTASGKLPSFNVTQEGGVQAIRGIPSKSTGGRTSYIEPLAMEYDEVFSKGGRLLSSSPNAATVAARSAAELANAGYGRGSGGGDSSGLTEYQAQRLAMDTTEMDRKARNDSQARVIDLATLVDQQAKDLQNSDEIPASIAPSAVPAIKRAAVQYGIPVSSLAPVYMDALTSSMDPATGKPDNLLDKIKNSKTLDQTTINKANELFYKTLQDAGYGQ